MKSNRLVLSAVFVAILSVGATGAFAGKKGVAPASGADEDAKSFAAIDEATKDIHWTTPEELAEYVKKPLSSFNRKIASAGDDYGAILDRDPEFVQLRKDVLSMRTAEDVANQVNKITPAFYDKLKSPNAKLMALEFAELAPLRGIIYRLVEVTQEHKAIHSVLLTKMMKIATRLGMYQPTTQAPALLEYLTKPYPGVVQFKDETAFQAYVAQYIVKATELSRKRVSQLDLTNPIIIDNQLAYQTTNPSDQFLNDTNYRYNLFQEGERQLLIALKCRSLKNQLAFTAFDVHGFLDLVADLGKLRGLDGIIPVLDIDGVPTRSIVMATTAPKYKNLLTFKSTLASGGPLAMKNAAFYNFEMVISLERARAALDSDKDKGVIDRARIFNMQAIGAATDNIDRVLPIWDAMIRGPKEVISRRTSEKVMVNVPAFWAVFQPENVGKPSILWDAKSLLPTSFTGDGDERRRYHTDYGKKWRDYHWGEPIGWNKDAYKIIFTNLPNGSEVGNYQAILKQSDGGKLVANLFDWVID
jgi:hypothetical protein